MHTKTMSTQNCLRKPDSVHYVGHSIPVPLPIRRALGSARRIHRRQAAANALTPVRQAGRWQQRRPTNAGQQPVTGSDTTRLTADHQSETVTLGHGDPRA